MYTSLRYSKTGTQEFTSSVQELFLSTSRAIIVVTGGIYLGLLLATAIWPEQLALNLWVVVPISLAIFIFAYRLMAHTYLLAHIFFLIGVFGSITLAMYLFQMPEIALLYAFLPMIAVVCLGLRAGLAVQLLVFGCLYWLYHGLLSVAPGIAIGAIVGAGSVFALMLGWESMRTTLTVTEWSLFSYKQAQINLEDARRHHGQLAHAVKELDSANIRLERLNRMLVLARADAEEAREARNRFALSVSHELRTPLNFIISFSEIMVNTPATYAPLKRWPPMLYDDIQEIYKSSQHLLRLVNDVLDLGRIENLQMSLFKEWVGLPQVIREVVGMMQRAFDLKGLELRLDLEDNLPQVFIDRTRIRQVLLNLVNNSLRFTTQGHVTIRVSLQDEHLQQVCVEDSGMGISPDQLPLVFDEFQQVYREGWYKQEGFGLGLPISKRFVELHHGQMWVESEPGQGSRFYFTLPALASSVTRPMDSKSSDERYWQTLQANARKGECALVVSSLAEAGAALAPLMGGVTLYSVKPEEDLKAHVAALLPQAVILDQAILHDPDLQNKLAQLPYDLPRISLRLPNPPGQETHLPDCVRFAFVKPVVNQVLFDALRSLGPEIHRLLIVTEDARMNNLLQRSLRANFPHYEVFMVPSDTEAVAHIYQQTPDVLVIDSQTPGLPGLQILEVAQDLKIPVILMTTDEWPQTASESGHETLSVQVPRPFSRSELTQVLANLIQVIRPRYLKDLSGLAPEVDLPG